MPGPIVTAAAEVGVGLDPQPLHVAGPGRRGLDVGDVVAAVDGALVVLAAGLDPLHRAPADRLAGEHHERHVRVAEDLGAEGAAHVRADAPDLVLRDAGHERGQQQPLDVRRLAEVRSCIVVPGLNSPMSPRTTIGFGNQAVLTGQATTTSAPSKAGGCRPCRRPATRTRRVRRVLVSWGRAGPGGRSASRGRSGSQLT